MKQCASGTGTNTASRPQQILAECYRQKYFFLMTMSFTTSNAIQKPTARFRTQLGTLMQLQRCSLRSCPMTPKRCYVDAQNSVWSEPVCDTMLSWDFRVSSFQLACSVAHKHTSFNLLSIRYVGRRQACLMIGLLIILYYSLSIRTPYSAVVTGLRCLTSKLWPRSPCAENDRYSRCYY